MFYNTDESGFGPGEQGGGASYSSTCYSDELNFEFQYFIIDYKDVHG